MFTRWLYPDRPSVDSDDRSKYAEAQSRALLPVIMCSGERSGDTRDYPLSWLRPGAAYRRQTTYGVVAYKLRSFTRNIIYESGLGCPRNKAAIKISRDVENWKLSSFIILY